MSGRLSSTTLWAKSAKKGHIDPLSGRELGDLTVLLYFAGKSSEECRKFTELLKSFHQETLRAKGFPVEVVFVSSDPNVETMLDHFVNVQGKWLTIKYDDVARRDLAKELGIQSLPSLVVIDKAGKQVVDSKECIQTVELSFKKKKNCDSTIKEWCKKATGWDLKEKPLDVVTSQEEFASRLLHQMNPNRVRKELDMSPEAEQKRLAALYKEQSDKLNPPARKPNPNASQSKPKTELRVESPEKILNDLGPRRQKREKLSPEEEQKRLAEFYAKQQEQIQQLSQGFKFSSPLYYKQYPTNQFDIVVNASNGLGIELGWTDKSDERVVISGFRELENGSWGPLESTGLVIIGDQIVRINDVPIAGLNMDQIGELIMKNRSRTKIRFQRKLGAAVGTKLS
eukprot:CAMPEP_0204833502 /NCGR_PEP_ID=MMETSP1346-20131115/17037_1 /ASSEMBLY_ACC=CAM_ASM_000771 /TAXON_ID=215587 /ORGANISM="Aplanochytrium stocchinoi, Strain GSBS06" /LENGTH=397 /DNA_ID=CAMNT_0051966095 /DNA_START=218 /DNA_END=1412 /DNA_ORIENTATION=+